MKKLLFLLVLLWSTIAMMAQNLTEDPKQIISEVKHAEGQYIYADQTSATVEKALEQAQEILLREVMDYLQQSGEDIDDVAAFVRDQMVTITIQRGDKFRAFVYIDKASDKERTSAAETESNTMANVPSVAEPTPKKVDTTSDTRLQQIASMTTRLQVYDFITQLQNDGEKVAFATHPTAQELESMYVVLYRRGGNIEAILTPPDERGQRYNLATGLPDTQANHPATSVNGFKLNE